MVDLTQSERVFAQDDELIRLDCQRVDLLTGLVSRCRGTLLGHADDQSFKWGYRLGADARRGLDRPLDELTQQLRRQVIEPIEHCRRAQFSFSFIKAAHGLPAVLDGVFSENLHLDTHPQPDGEHELLRVLINLDSQPRTLRFAAIERADMVARPLTINRMDFRVPTLPSDVEIREVQIPGFDRRTLGYLTFWASRVPHVGIEEGSHFLASFEAVLRR